MNFVSFEFLGFLGAVYVFHWLLPQERARKWLLTVASYLFYAAWDWRFCLLMSFVTVNAFTAGHLVSSFERSGRLLIMARSIGIDLAVLALRNYSFASFPPVVVQASDILCVRGPEYGAFHVEAATVKIPQACHASHQGSDVRRPHATRTGKSVPACP